MIATRPHRTGAHYDHHAPYCAALNNATHTLCHRTIGHLDDVRYLSTMLDLDRPAARINWCANCLAASPDLRAILRAAAHATLRSSSLRSTSDNTPEEDPL